MRRRDCCNPSESRHFRGPNGNGVKLAPLHDSCSTQAVLDSDFFSYCTSLKPLQLKAIGELSHVRHLAEGEIVYRAGDPGEALYIINRGAVEISQDNAGHEPAAASLTRGDMFGDLEALTNLPRSQVVRACEPVSLQVFPRKNFGELQRRVPSFFQYLAEHLANRLIQARDFALSQSDCLELSGSLANFDVVTIYQTIVNSLQSGELTLIDERSEVMGAFMFEAGQPRCGQFHHLNGEEAFWQLFLSSSLAGSFSFSSNERATSDGIQAGQITRKPGDMLINALQFRDEFEELKSSLHGGKVVLRRAKLNFDWHGADSSLLREAAEQIWQIAYSTPVTVAALYKHCAVCELKIYRIVQELVASGHFMLVPPSAAEKIA